MNNTAYFVKTREGTESCYSMEDLISELLYCKEMGEPIKRVLATTSGKQEDVTEWAKMLPLD